MSYLKEFWSSVSEKWDERLLHHSGSTPSWGTVCPCRTCGAQHTWGACGSGPSGSPGSLQGPHKMLWPRRWKENLRSEGSWFRGRPGRHQPCPSLYWSVEESPGWWSLLRRWCPVALCWVFSPGVCAEEKLQPFSGQLGLPFLTGVAEVPEVCMVLPYIPSAYEGCRLKILYFTSCPYWWQKERKKMLKI